MKLQHIMIQLQV